MPSPASKGEEAVQPESSQLCSLRAHGCVVLIDIKMMDRKVRMRLLDKLEESELIRRTKRSVVLATGKKERLVVVYMPDATEEDGK